MPLPLPSVVADRYELTSEIGRGGHAIVYRAHDRALDRDVAVKVLREDTMSGDVLARFEQEVQVMAHLEHAHILHVYDTGAVDGRPYVVMELAVGETLAARLRREAQLPLAEALEIAHDIGRALAHAHANGVVHRDVKPENVLLGAGGAVLADFGIARVTNDLAIITSTGVAVGTVLYMSPEQLFADRTIDGRSDQYSLACVLYEMLAGVRPHVSATVEGLRMLRLNGEHASVRSHRSSVPESVDAALRVALSPTAADRFRTVDEFLAALGATTAEASANGASPRVAAPRVERAHRPRFALATTGIAAGAIVAGIAWVGRDAFTSAPFATTGRTVHVETSAAQRGDPTLGHAVMLALVNELGSWPDVNVVDAIGARDTSAVSATVSAVPLGDSVRIIVSVTGASSAAHRVLTVVPSSAIRSTSTVAFLARRVLGGRAIDDAPGVDAMPGRSLGALTAYARGWTLLRGGQLDSAQAAFHAAAEASAGFAQASLWAAQSGAWARPQQPDSWKPDAEAANRAGALAPSDSAFARALLAMANRAYPDACDAYRAMLQRDASSFAAGFGVGECQRLDTTVVLGAHGLAFRTSHWGALRAYQAALERAPTSELLAVLFPRVLAKTYADGNVARWGNRGQESFGALPELSGDSIALHPIPSAAFMGLGRGAVPQSYLAAVRLGRSIALGMTRAWVRRWPASSDAWFEHAIALELAGQIADGAPEASASAALRRAASGAPTELSRVRIAVAETRLALRHLDFVRAGSAARSALQRLPADTEARDELGPLAALIGDVEATSILRPASAASKSILSADLADSVQRFRVRAVLGECAELDASRQSIESRFRITFAPAELQSQRTSILLPIYREAVPCLGPSALTEFAAETPLDSVYHAIARRDSTTARRILYELRSRRSGASAASIAWDYLFSESWALGQLGESALARTQVTTALSGLPEMSPNTLRYFAQAAGLRRALGLLRDLPPADAGERQSIDWSAQFVALTEPHRR